MRGLLLVSRHQGTTMLEPLFKCITENPLLFIPAVAVLLFACVLHFLLRQRDAGTRRLGLLFGIGFSAMLASFVFVVFTWSFVRLLMRGLLSFDGVWMIGAVGAGLLTTWLWFRFFLLMRQK